jgi:photosystem II stability/assembly factor-like uncharacterized protein
MKSFILIFTFSLLASSAHSQWIPQNSGTTERFLTVFFLDQNYGWAGGNEGCIVKTTNGGTDWTYFSIGTKYTVHAIHFVDTLKGWAVLYTFIPDRAGYVIATTDGGANWFYQYYINGVTLHNIYFYDEYFGWAVGSSGIFLRTVNGGLNWQEDFVSPEWSWSLFFLSPNIGWVGDGYSGYIRKTTDGGFTWQYKSIPTYSRMMDITFINENIGWAVGQNGQILKTLNGGETWNHQNSFVAQDLNDVEFVNENDGWVVGLEGRILHTSDGGNNWNLQISNTTNDLHGLSIKNEILGWIAGDQGIVLHTKNGGGGITPVELIAFNGEYYDGEVNLSWATATELNNSGFEVERKTKFGDWEKVAFIQGNGTTTETKYYSYADIVIDYSSAKLSYRLKQIDFDGSAQYSREIEIDIALPNKFNLEQNYPNPFNPSTMIRFALPQKSAVTIIVYNSVGEEVHVLLNEIIDAGYHQVRFNTGVLSSGIYFYTLKADNFVQTRKMILLK